MLWYNIFYLARIQGKLMLGIFTTSWLILLTILHFTIPFVRGGNLLYQSKSVIILRNHNSC